MSRLRIYIVPANVNVRHVRRDYKVLDPTAPITVHRRKDGTRTISADTMTAAHDMIERAYGLTLDEDLS